LITSIFTVIGISVAIYIRVAIPSGSIETVNLLATRYTVFFNQAYERLIFAAVDRNLQMEGFFSPPVKTVDDGLLIPNEGFWKYLVARK
jgi:hypothetical protein